MSFFTTKKNFDVVFNDDDSVISRVPLSIVECSQSLGICALPGKDVFLRVNNVT